MKPPTFENAMSKFVVPYMSGTTFMNMVESQIERQKAKIIPNTKDRTVLGFITSYVKLNGIPDHDCKAGPDSGCRLCAAIYDLIGYPYNDQ